MGDPTAPVGVTARALTVLLMLTGGVAGCLAEAPDPASPAPAFALTCADPCKVPVVTGPGSQREPMLSVNPNNPAHLVIAVQEGSENVAYVTFDSGAGWQRVELPPEVGAGPARPVAEQRYMSDPMALVLRDGTVLYASLAADRAPTPAAAGAGAMVSQGLHLDVARSEDGGRTYPTVVRVAEGNGATALPLVPGVPPVPAAAEIQDKEWLVEGPRGEVLMVWTHHVVGFGASELLWSVTRDSGRTWSAPGRVDGPDAGAFHGSMPAITRDGTWLVAYVQTSRSTDAQEAACCMRLLLARSADQGATWERTEFHPAVPFQMIQMEAAAGPGGAERLYLVHSVGADGTLGGFADQPREALVLTWSEDAGRTWVEPVPLAPPQEHPGPLLPALDVAPDGTVLVSHYHYAAADRMERWVTAWRGGPDTHALVIDPDIPGPARLPGALGDYMGIAARDGDVVNVWTAPGEEGRDLFGATVRWRAGEAPHAIMRMKA